MLKKGSSRNSGALRSNAIGMALQLYALSSITEY
jgi:hypothetical protein